MTGKTAVIAGNGVSLTRILPGRIRSDDLIIRTNNFFFEPEFYLGQRVDLYFAAGDPRVARFMFETLHQCRADYDLRGWTSHNPAVIRSGQRRFASLFQPLRYRDARIETQVQALSAQFGKMPTTGILALLAAHGLGIERAILVGMDMYSGSQRYPYEPGPNQRALMGLDLNQRGVDARLHDTALDHEILQILLAREDIQILRASEGGPLDDSLPLAPERATGADALCAHPRSSPPRDWVSRSGLYPISLLKLLRRGSALKRRLQGQAN